MNSEILTQAFSKENLERLYYASMDYATQLGYSIENDPYDNLCDLYDVVTTGYDLDITLLPLTPRIEVYVSGEWRGDEFQRCIQFTIEEVHCDDDALQDAANDYLDQHMDEIERMLQSIANTREVKLCA